MSTSAATVTPSTSTSTPNSSSSRGHQLPCTFPGCTETCSSPSNLKRHIRDQHMNNKRLYICQLMRSDGSPCNSRMFISDVRLDNRMKHETKFHKGCPGVLPIRPKKPSGS